METKPYQLSKEENIMKKPYECSICGKQNVKLWRPYMGTEPLICATCAEERQSPKEYDECIWKMKGDHYVGTPTERKLPLPKWKVNAEGKVPSYFGPGPDGLPMEMTDQLIVNLKDVSQAYSSGETAMIPAVPDEDGDYWGYTSVPEDRCKWWNELPTK